MSWRFRKSFKCELLNWGLRAPNPALLNQREAGLLYAVNRTDRLLIKPDILTF